LYRHYDGKRQSMSGNTLPERSFPHAAMYIDGAWQDGAGRPQIEVENPADELIVGTIVDGTTQDASDAIEAAHRAQPAWAALPPIQRGKLVARLAQAVESSAEMLARIITQEQGKPLSQARGEVDAVMTFFNYAAENARRIEGDLMVSDNVNEEIHIRRHPYGVVVGLTSWNYPAALAARKLGPALVAGNTFVLLSHENTPLSGLALAKLADDVGFPAGVFNVVTGRGGVIGQALVEHPLVSMVTMTGSTRAGQQIYRTGAETIKTIRLELGGKAPFIVMEDADIESAVTAAVTARYTNCGQICTCNERMFLHQSIADEFLDKFVAASRALTIGDPMSDVDMGPKISRLERDKVDSIVKQSIEAGAEVLLSGGPLQHEKFQRGHWYAPTVLEASDNELPAIRDEVFGPVAVALRVDSFEQAVQYANDTDFGLSAYVFTQNFSRLQRAPYELNFGELYLNRSNGEAVQGFHTGWGLSGQGGEDGKYGFDGYLRKQTSYLKWS